MRKDNPGRVRKIHRKSTNPIHAFRGELYPATATILTQRKMRFRITTNLCSGDPLGASGLALAGPEEEYEDDGADALDTEDVAGGLSVDKEEEKEENNCINCG